MPIVRFIREGKDVKCRTGENLREIALREGMELYGFKGSIGNCGGCGQWITCFVSIESENQAALSTVTEIEKTKLKNRPHTWRLACQSIVKSSLVVLTKPQSPPANSQKLIQEALAKGLPNWFIWEISFAFQLILVTTSNRSCPFSGSWGLSIYSLINYLFRLAASWVHGNHQFRFYYQLAFRWYPNDLSSRFIYLH